MCGHALWFAVQILPPYQLALLPQFAGAFSWSERMDKALQAPQHCLTKFKKDMHIPINLCSMYCKFILYLIALLLLLTGSTSS
jgi:hypothetical protein